MSRSLSDVFACSQCTVMCGLHAMMAFPEQETQSMRQYPPKQANVCFSLILIDLQESVL